jgi:membrane carboxypeptidase/penicillin-binding protein
MMTIAIERRLTKEQIFALYCDRIYLGHSGATAIYGFKRAAVIFFGKELRDLSLSEAARLSGAEVEVGRALAKPIKQVMPPGSLPKPIKHLPFP